ncbi:MAG: DNA-directed DNA polymerase II small subunit [Nitrososphaerota archaeon]|nr:DNA-directed DNA polymerase II small subunit [Aigarchaeota archaeon]MDW8076288.1 DNA-directed DNA polymerase II small subunit [Nitrososphaerota archaeon]
MSSLDDNKKIIMAALRNGYHLTEKALEILRKLEDPIETLNIVIKHVREKDPHCIVLDAELIETLVQQTTKPQESKPIHNEEPFICPEVQIIQHYPEDVVIQGKLEEFYRYFHNRYIKLRKILEERGIKFMPLSEIVKLKKDQDAAAVVMVLDKKDTEKALVFECEDPSTNTSVFVPKKAGDVFTKAEMVLVDYVVGMKLRKVNDMLLVQDIIQPDVPINQKQTPPGPNAYVCFASDIHIGSKNFRKDLFESFLDWINRGRDGEVKRIGYVILCGDLVDGVGVYPGQEKELEVVSINEQFNMAAKLLSEIPGRIKLIYSPGNHEPVRKALPQPPLPETYKKILESGREITFVGNPAKILISNRLIYLYHGQSLDDLIQALPNVSYSTLHEKIGEILEVVLRARHLAPCYGQNTPILPLDDDPLVIEEVPDMLCTGHVHVAGVKSYKGVLLINSGCWQEQTSFQQSFGLKPTVGTAVLVNLTDMSTKIKLFS